MGIWPRASGMACSINRSFEFNKDERSVPFVQKIAVILYMSYMNPVRLLI